VDEHQVVAQLSIPAGGLGNSARKALVLSGSATLFQDVAQFCVMLVLVRLLTPADYGTVALAQAIVAFASALSYQSFAVHTVQFRDPSQIDWQAQFTAAVGINAVVSALTLLVAAGLFITEVYEAAAMPLAALTLTFLVEVWSVIRYRMLETAHDWLRLRILTLSGVLLGLFAGLAIALMGGGLWALVVQPLLAQVPLAIDVVCGARFRPDWSWNWRHWQATFRFGVERIGATLLFRARALNENVLMSGVYNLAALGIFTRAIGLSILFAGRIGLLATMSLHPVLTRVAPKSEHFQRLAGLVLRGIVWTTIPAVAFLCLAAHDIVALLYGSQWTSVIEFIPLASVWIALTGIVTSIANLLVANQNSRAGMCLEAVSAASSIVLAIVLIPHGALAYLAGLSVHALIVSVAAVHHLLRCKAARRQDVVASFVPTIIASTIGLLAAMAVRSMMGVSSHMVIRLAIDAAVLAAAYLLVLRVLYPERLSELLVVAPGGGRLTRIMGIARAAPR
jgi:O-antigen/teichoic acid export membrane protein